MSKFLLCALLCISALVSYAQDHGFPFGQVTYAELDMVKYHADTAAVAVMLNEFGEAYFDNSNDHNLLFEYHAKIKILKTEGLSYGTCEIPLRKSEGKSERIRSIKASAFNIENGTMRETKLDLRKVFQEDQNKYHDAKKFAIPNVKVGSVIELSYTLESPFFYNFRSWEFQSEIPKLQSEYWCTIPANYVYNIALTGFLKLTMNESELLKDCFSPGGNKADCSRLKYGIKNVPAFKEEEFMTAKSNFLSALDFELSQINYFDGRKNKITKEWKDADHELRFNPEFGIQIKKGKDIVDAKIEEIIAGEKDGLTKAQKIYEFIKAWYRWNGVLGKYSEFGIKKAFESKTGNVGDINLSLIAALKYADITVEPVLLSTRQNGLPKQLYPVLSDFNYVIAKVSIADKVYLLDATDNYYPFGMLPERCLNGKGRVLGEKESYWHELKPSDREKTVAVINLELSDDIISGTINYTFSGYEAVTRRRKLQSFPSQQEFIDDLKAKLPRVIIKKFTIENTDDLHKPLIVKMDVDIEMSDTFGEGSFLFNPFIIDRLQRNPFKSNDRLYPVDFGTPREEIIILNFQYPLNYEVDEMPKAVKLSLPENGGRYIFDIQNSTNKLSMHSSLLIAKPVFSSYEYHYLKELFNHVIAAQQSELVFKQKK
jgi:hypothetical protein